MTRMGHGAIANGRIVVANRAVLKWETMKVTPFMRSVMNMKYTIYPFKLNNTGLVGRLHPTFGIGKPSFLHFHAI